MDLSLDDPPRTAELLRSLDGGVGGLRDAPGRYRNAEASKDFLGLVLVDFHASMSSRKGFSRAAMLHDLRAQRPSRGVTRPEGNVRKREAIIGESPTSTSRKERLDSANERPDGILKRATHRPREGREPESTREEPKRRWRERLERPRRSSVVAPRPWDALHCLESSLR